MRLPIRIIYAWSVILTGLVILAAFFPHLEFERAREMLLLSVLGAIAEWLAVSYQQGRFSGISALAIASFLIYGASGAAWVIALGTLIGQGVVKRENPARITLFNVSRQVLTIMSAGYFYYLCGGRLGNAAGVGGLFPLCVLAGFYLFLNYLLVRVYLLSGGLRQPPLGRWEDLKRDGPVYLFNAAFGVFAGALYSSMGILGAVLVITNILLLQFAVGQYFRLDMAERELGVMYLFTNALKEQHKNDIPGFVLRSVYRAVPYQSGIVYLWVEEEGYYRAAAVHGSRAGQLRGHKVFPKECFIGRVAEKGLPELIFDARKDPRLTREPGLAQVYRSMLVVPLQAGSHKVGILVLCSKKKFYYNEHNLHLLSLVGGQAAAAISNVLMSQRMEKNIKMDSLTGLFNRRYFFRALDETLREVSAVGKKAALIIIDIDGFKKINDGYGTSAGDSVLVELADLLRETVGSSGVTARYGDEEFCIIMPRCNKERALIWGEQICRAVREHDFLVRGKTIPVKVSLGISVFPDDAVNVSKLIKGADHAMHLAKQLGGDRVQMAS